MHESYEEHFLIFGKRKGILSQTINSEGTSIVLISLLCDIPWQALHSTIRAYKPNKQSGNINLTRNIHV